MAAKEISYEFGWLPILISLFAAAGSFGNFYLNLAAKLHWWPSTAG